jgi:ATP-binding cassette subfamily B multidrug efflux pump
MRHLFALNHYFYRYKGYLLIGFAFVILSNFFAVLPPQAIRYAFDLVRDNIAYYQLYSGFDLQSKFYGVFSSAILLFGITVLALALLRGVFMFLMRQTIIVTSRYIEYDLRNDIYDQYQRLSAAFYKRNRTGDLMARATEDVNRVRMYLGPAIMYTVNMTATVIITIVAMLQVNVEMTLYVLIPLPILSISIYFVNSVIHRRSERIQQEMSQLTSAAQEAFSGIRVVKAYVQEKANLDYFAERAEQYKERTLKMAQVQALFMPLMVLLVGISTILTIYIGGQKVINGEITSGNIAEFIIYVTMLTWPVTSIGWVASLVQRAAASQKRINEFMHLQPDIVSAPNAQKKNLLGDIVFDNVSFTYPDTGIEALKNVSFHIKQGERWAIIGRTGAGKSTIADLLVRKYEVTSGSIRLDNIDIKQLDLYELRRQIGYVPQEVFLFSDTIQGNIAFGIDHFDQQNVIQAAQQAAVYDDIERLPNGLKTIVGERGITLSGGQKQRISLARALIKKPQIILLDDCLSAVDTETEQQIIKTLNTILKHKTAIIVTHRLPAQIEFDRIITLENGEIIE